VVFHTIKRHYALKEGFNVKSGKSLKAVDSREGRTSGSAGTMAEEGLVFRSF
jgi:hypothetical protein